MYLFYLFFRIVVVYVCVSLKFNMQGVPKYNLSSPPHLLYFLSQTFDKFYHKNIKLTLYCNIALVVYYWFLDSRNLRTNAGKNIRCIVGFISLVHNIESNNIIICLIEKYGVV